MTTLVSLGSNCHPAWWLRKLEFRTASLPFDWLVTEPYQGLDYAIRVQSNGFADWLEDITRTPAGRPCSMLYPEAEFLYHQDLLADDPAARDAERRKLEERAEAFLTLVNDEPVEFLYCYDLRHRLPEPFEQVAFEESVEAALEVWPSANLHVYFLFDKPGLMDGGPLLTPRPRLFEHAHFRNRGAHGQWGQEPEFFRAIANEVSAMLVTA